MLIYNALNSQSPVIESIYIYGKTYMVKSISMYKSIDGKDSAIINLEKKSNKFAYRDRNDCPCVDQSGAQLFSLYDVIKVGTPRTFSKRVVLREFLDTIYFDSIKVYLREISLNGEIKDLHLETIRFLKISPKHHFETILSFPHNHLKLAALVEAKESNCSNIMDSIAFY